ncbi:hypothetical protein RIR_jg21783.t1 [Rhizophagus irregularis DAOM 181602=DAOM 197198]|nr:hypothetical protein RIR_jg21783.t1 [Rhizophagus irregularis DAOM 181602=DAOM 197198]CAB4374651.1 unnamed protein product [Rhizophagus irregularis]CAB5375478.1 unnamed protein product [Rhizophagus irregularis]
MTQGEEDTTEISMNENNNNFPVFSRSRYPHQIYQTKFVPIIFDLQFVKCIRIVFLFDIIFIIFFSICFIS